MLIYGSKAVHLKSIQPRMTSCPSCGTQGSIVLSVYRKHAHIFWIPIFPIGKKGVSECKHCKNVLKSNEMSGAIKNEYVNLKNDAKGPVWQFAGLPILAILAMWIVYISGENKKLGLEYISAPVKGDVYEYIIKSGSYSTLKVINVSNDSVFVSPNEFEINKRSRIYKIDKPENYSELSYGISRNKLKEMYDSGEIFDVNR